MSGRQPDDQSRGMRMRTLKLRLNYSGLPASH